MGTTQEACLVNISARAYLNSTNIKKLELLKDYRKNYISFKDSKFNLLTKNITHEKI